MVCFAACVIVSFEKRGKRTNEKDRILVFFGLVIIIIGKNGVSAFFVVVLFCEFITPSSVKFKTLVPPAGTYIYTLLHRTDRQIRGSFELDRFARKQYHSWQNVRIIYLTERGKREKERKLVKKR